MSESIEPSGSSRSVSAIPHSDKSAYWEKNFRAELQQRKGYDHGHTLNPKDGFWDWYRKYQFLHGLNENGVRRRTPRKNKVSGRKYFNSFKEGRNNTDALKQYIDANFPKRVRAHPTLHNISKTVPYTSGVERVADLISGETTGTVLLGHDYIGPGNPIYSGDDKELTSTDRIAKEHDVQYGLISKFAKNKDEVRELTDKADTEGIEKFWNDSHIFNQITSGDIPDFGSLFGAAGLLGKRTYERTFGQTYPSPDIIKSKCCLCYS